MPKLNSFFLILQMDSETMGAFVTFYTLLLIANKLAGIIWKWPGAHSGVLASIALCVVMQLLVYMINFHCKWTCEGSFLRFLAGYL